MTTLSFPFRAAASGRSATVEQGHDERARELLRLLVFTGPGERVMRPDLGSPTAHLVFEGLSSALGAALQASIHAAIQQWLGTILDVHDIRVDAPDAEGAVLVEIAYEVRRTRTVASVQLRRSVG